ncbi:MAG: hypothetical protein M1136_07560, partial [Chloroflexi bacterium]|nr:hypothetical protein [Chloroflexota bacterium]
QLLHRALDFGQAIKDAFSPALNTSQLLFQPLPLHAKRIVRGLREAGVCEFAPTIRGCIMVAKALKVLDGSVDAHNDLFRQLCLDILASESTRVGSKSQTSKVKEAVSRLVDQYC